MANLKDLEAIIPPTLLNATGVPSASIAILVDGKVSTHVITSGKEDVDTIYQAASISKAICSLGVAKLIDEGHFTYDTLIVDHLAKKTIDLMVDDRTRHLFDAVTVGMLVSHISGLTQHGFPGYDGDAPSADTILAGEAPSNTPRVHFYTFPGAVFSYSGGGFTVLQLFLETVLSKPFAQIMHDTVLAPLKMTRSHYGPLSPTEKNYANAYQTATVPAYTTHHIFPEQAAAGLWTTPSDLLKAIAAIQTSLSPSSNTAPFLSKQKAADLLTTVRSDVALSSSVARGFFTTAAGFGHSGGNAPGYITYFMGSWPDAKKGVVPNTGIAVMTNSVQGIPAVGSVLAAVLYLLGWEQPVALPSFTVAEKWMPYALPRGLEEVDEKWREWQRDWEGGWKLSAGLDGMPVFSFGDLRPMVLRPAAAPVSILGEGRREVVLVVDGLDTSLRLTWDESGEKVVKLLQGEEGGVKTLTRKEVKPSPE